MMVSGRAQGKKAGEMALRRLSGRPVSSLPVYEGSLNRRLFDFDQMKRFGVRREMLPADAEVIKPSRWGDNVGSATFEVIVPEAEPPAEVAPAGAAEPGCAECH